LINKPQNKIKILMVICDIHQFHLRFSHGVFLLFRSLEICLQ